MGGLQLFTEDLCRNCRPPLSSNILSLVLRGLSSNTVMSPVHSQTGRNPRRLAKHGVRRSSSSSAADFDYIELIGMHSELFRLAVHSSKASFDVFHSCRLTGEPSDIAHNRQGVPWHLSMYSSYIGGCQRFDA